MKVIICSKCRRLVPEKGHYLEVSTENNLTFNFCLACIRLGYDTLSDKEEMTLAEEDLLRGFSAFLREHGLIAEA